MTDKDDVIEVLARSKDPSTWDYLDQGRAFRHGDLIQNTLIQARKDIQTLLTAGYKITKEEGWNFNIDAAPKDKLLDMSDGKIVVMAEWDAIDHDPQSGEDVYWWQPYDNVRATEFVPTAWRLRPSPPKSGQ